MLISQENFKREIRICVDPRVYLLEIMGNPIETETALKNDIYGFFKENLPYYQHIDTTNPYYFRFGTNEIEPAKDHLVLREFLTNDLLGIKSSVCALNIVDYEEGKNFDFLEEQRESYKEFLDVIEDKIADEPEAFEKITAFAKGHPFMTKEQAKESMSEIDFY